jgi:hypothetical protein
MPSRWTFASCLRLLGALTASAALSLGGLPAFAAAPTDVAADAPADAASCVHLVLDNPHAGDTIPFGKYAVSGRAVDTSGAAVDRVQLFLEDRNLGGLAIGEADLTVPDGAPALVAQSSLASNGSFSVITDTSGSNSNVGAHTMFAYARSSGGLEVNVAVPVVLQTRSGGAGSTLSNALSNVSNSADCPPPAPPTNIVSPTGQNVVATAAAAAPPETINVEVDSPHPGATITRGRFEVAGRATTSTGGAIDRVQVFLDNRDLGGIELGEISTSTTPMSVPNTTLVSSLNSNGTFDIIVNFPDQHLGVHTVFVYARSATTGKEVSANTSVTVNR